MIWGENPTWEETERELEYIRAAFIRLHETLEKNWTEDQKARAKVLRDRCRVLGEIRYSLISGRGKNFETSEFLVGK